MQLQTPFEIIQAAPFPLATLTQQAELYARAPSCTFAKGKTANIYTDSQYDLWTAHDFGMLWKQQGFLTSNGKKITNDLCTQFTRCQTFAKCPGYY